MSFRSYNEPPDSIPLETGYRGFHGGSYGDHGDHGNNYGENFGYDSGLYQSYQPPEQYGSKNFSKPWQNQWHRPSDDGGVGILSQDEGSSYYREGGTLLHPGDPSRSDRSGFGGGPGGIRPPYDEPPTPPPPFASKNPISASTMMAQPDPLDALAPTGSGPSRPVVRGGNLWTSGRWKKLPWFVWTVSVIQIAVFIAELAKMGVWTGTPIQLQPTFNPMIGPSSYVMINMGARFTPCMHAIPNVTDVSGLQFPCPNSTTTDTDKCSLSQLCGMGGIKPKTPPHQWWRFITPIFLHAGFIHIGFNLLLQLKLGAELEQDIGIPRFVLVYFASGISGFVLGGNFTPDGIASTGASGSLFGVIALDLLDLLFNWQLYEHPKRNLIIHIVEIIVSFVIGLLPGLDNFSHIGGFAMGILVGTAILRSPLKIRAKQVPIGPVGDPAIDQFLGKDGVPAAAPAPHRVKLRVEPIEWRNPRKTFENRSRWWYGWLLVRLAAIVLAIVYFVMLIKQFDNGGGNCSWCKYLSCLPVHGWCDQGELTTSSTN